MNETMIKYEINQDGEYCLIDFSNEDESIDILPCYENELDKAIAKLNKKAAKFDCGTVQIEKKRVTRKRKVRDALTGRMVEREYEYINVQLTGRIVKIAGYEFICKVEFIGDMPIILTAPEKTAPAFARETAPDRCDQCHAHRKRSAVFILQHTESGEYVQVGSTCLKDYLGHDAQHIVRMFQWLKEVKEQSEFFGFGRDEQMELSLDVLAMTSAVIRKFGWVSRAKSLHGDGNSTANVVGQCFRPISKYDHEIKAEVGQPTDLDRSIALKTLEYIDSIKQKEATTDYEYNLIALSSLEKMPSKRYGFWCSAVAAYNRHIGNLETNKALASSQHIGIVGDRITGTGTLKHLHTFEGNYGATTIVSIHDNSGNVFKWFTKGAFDIEIGSTINFAGTVKKHGEYRNVKETVLTRCKLFAV